MRRHWPLFPTALSLLFALAAPSYSDDAPPAQGALYLGQGRMLEAAAPRQLSLNAHVTQFAFQPGSLEIAYVGSEQDGDQVTQFVRLAGVKYGKTVTLLSHDEIGNSSGYMLVGWTADARYLLVQSEQFTTDSNRPDALERTVYFCVDVGASPIRARTITLPTVPPTANTVLDSAWRSSNHDLFLIEQKVLDTGIKGEHTASIYDPARDRLDTFPLDDKEYLYGWLDEGHVLLSTRGATRQFSSLDTATGKQAEVPQPKTMPHMYEGILNGMSPKTPLLSLEVTAQTLPDSQKVATEDAHALWVRRTQGPKVMSAMPVGLTPGKEDPQAVWSPDGKQIAFVAHGDLFVTDLSERDAQPKEKYLAGEPLTCPEERELATGSVRQIGLAILQFVQDNDENWPTPEEQRDKLAPYLPPDVLLSVGGHPFAYHVPPDLALAKMDSPAEFVLGTMDLPCATVTLFADGHVKSFPKQGMGAGNANN